jgi:hypothetical protein
VFVCSNPSAVRAPEPESHCVEQLTSVWVTRIAAVSTFRCIHLPWQQQAVWYPLQLYTALLSLARSDFQIHGNLQILWGVQKGTAGNFCPFRDWHRTVQQTNRFEPTEAFSHSLTHLSLLCHWCMKELVARLCFASHKKKIWLDSMSAQCLLTGLQPPCRAGNSYRCIWV